VLQGCNNELDREVGAHARRLARQNPSMPAPTGGKKLKKFNLFMYKFHALGDYVSSIRWFGSTESYSTEMVHLWGERNRCIVAFLTSPVYF
jgi:hypothetical protein